MTRGFSVVAEEVRTLAQRCASSAREIGTVITETESQVSLGLANADDAGNSLSAISVAVREVADKSEFLSSKNAAQLRKMLQIQQTVIRLDQATQATAAASEQASASAQNLASQGAGLTGLSDRLSTLINGSSTN